MRTKRISIAPSTLLAVATAMAALAACEDGPRAGAALVDGRRVTVAECASTADAGNRRPGQCWNGADITDRTNRDTTRNVTPATRDNTQDITDRRNRDDTTDRTVWCASVGRVIAAPFFTVYFAWDKSDLAPEAFDTIRQAADAYRAKGGAKLAANGFTDTSGPADYNMSLSLRRANAVKAELVRDGVPEADISVVGYGETQLKVQTPDGVREAQNRRVEIVVK